MTPSYQIIMPSVIRFGERCTDELPSIHPADANRILFLAGTHAVSAGYAGRIVDLLEKSGRKVRLLCGVQPEPSPDEVDRIITAGREFQAQAVIALGGGSVMDAGKAAAAIIPLSGSCSDYFSGKYTIPGKGLFFAAMPTTAGTGAEMTSNSVLTDAVSKVKKSLRSPFMTPDVALCDPVFTWDAPAQLTAYCGLDAFVQAVECYTSIRGNDFTRPLALKALKKIAFALPRVYADGSDRQARADMAEGSMLTGIAFAQCGLGAVHGLAHPIGSLRHVPHGAACAILMTRVFRFNAETVPAPYAEIAEYLGIGSRAEDFIQFTAGLAGKLNIPDAFASYGFTDKDFDFVIKNCRSGSMKSNPRYMSDEEVTALLNQLI